MSDFYLAALGLCCTVFHCGTWALAVERRLFSKRRRRKRRQDWSLPEAPPNHLHLQRRGSPQHTLPPAWGMGEEGELSAGRSQEHSTARLSCLKGVFSWLGASASHTLSTVTLTETVTDGTRWPVHWIGKMGPQETQEGWRQPALHPSLGLGNHRPRQVPEAHRACHLTRRVFFKTLPKFRAEKDIGSRPDSGF